MIRTMSVISSFISVLLILGLNKEQAVAQNYVANIGKLLILTKEYYKGYNYFRKDYCFSTRYEDPDEVAAYTHLQYDIGYIDAQIQDGTNFSELNSIFVLQTIAMIYALKLRESPATLTFERIQIYHFLARFGTLSESVAPAILRTLERKYPKLYEEFDHISKIFENFKTNVDLAFFGPLHTNEVEKNAFQTKLKEDSETLIQYIRTKFLQDTGEHNTGLGIDGDTLSFNVQSVASAFKEKPNKLYYNPDDTTGENKMFKSTAMKLIVGLIEKIAENISDQTRTDVGEFAKTIDSFVHVRREETTEALIFKEIPYAHVKDVFPKRIAQPVVSNTWAWNWFPFFRSESKNKDD